MNRDIQELGYEYQLTKLTAERDALADALSGIIEWCVGGSLPIGLIQKAIAALDLAKDR